MANLMNAAEYQQVFDHNDKALITRKSLTVRGIARNLLLLKGDVKYVFRPWSWPRPPARYLIRE